MDLQRITEMEDCLNECTAAIAGLETQLDRMERLKEPMTRLFSYYGSSAWRSDLELDEQGLLPEGLQRGEVVQLAVFHDHLQSRRGVDQLFDDIFVFGRVGDHRRAVFFADEK